MAIRTLSPDDLPAAGEILLQSFKHYEVMRYMFTNAEGDYNALVTEFLLFFCRMSLAHSWPCLGLFENGELLAVTAGRGADDQLQQSFNDEFDRFCEKVGPEAAQQIQRYEQGSADMHHDQPHYFVEVIGVHPDHQGKGYAKELLIAVEQISNQDPLSTGVCLNTESPGNVPFYQRMGYQLTIDRAIDNIHSWCFFKAKQSP